MVFGNLDRAEVCGRGECGVWVGVVYIRLLDGRAVYEKVSAPELHRLTGEADGSFYKRGFAARRVFEEDDVAPVG
jgi:hypothetical protein